jgi:hypothetical protein
MSRKYPEIKRVTEIQKLNRKIPKIERERGDPVIVGILYYYDIIIVSYLI